LTGGLALERPQANESATAPARTVRFDRNPALAARNVLGAEWFRELTRISEARRVTNMIFSSEGVVKVRKMIWPMTLRWVLQVCASLDAPQRVRSTQIYPQSKLQLTTLALAMRST
jgi:hypothetical protein